MMSQPNISSSSASPLRLVGPELRADMAAVVWRGSELGSAVTESRSAGCQALNQELPSGGRLQSEKFEMIKSQTQAELFDAEDARPSISGLRYERDFLSEAEEFELIKVIHSLSLEPAKYKEYLARRRVRSFGGQYDFDVNLLRPSADLDARLMPLRAKVAAWLSIPPQALVHALVAEYAPGTPLGWHRDVPNFELIAGVSLGSSATIRLRRYPPEPGSRASIRQLEVEPRSIYKLEGEARWSWQHCVSPTKALRWSVTFRTAVLP